MEFKRNMMYAMMGGMIAVGYMKYKDGTLKRAIKNAKPMMENMINDLKK